MTDLPGASGAGMGCSTGPMTRHPFFVFLFCDLFLIFGGSCWKLSQYKGQYYLGMYDPRRTGLEWQGNQVVGGVAMHLGSDRTRIFGS